MTEVESQLKRLPLRIFDEDEPLEKKMKEFNSHFTLTQEDKDKEEKASRKLFTAMGKEGSFHFI